MKTYTCIQYTRHSILLEYIISFYSKNALLYSTKCVFYSIPPFYLIILTSIILKMNNHAYNAYICIHIYVYK